MLGQAAERRPRAGAADDRPSSRRHPVLEAGERLAQGEGGGDVVGRRARLGARRPGRRWCGPPPAPAPARGPTGDRRRARPRAGAVASAAGHAPTGRDRRRRARRWRRRPGPPPAPGPRPPARPRPSPWARRAGRRAAPRRSGGTPRPGGRSGRAAAPTAAAGSGPGRWGRSGTRRRGPPSPHGHGLVAPTSRNRAGSSTASRARDTRMTPSSSGVRRASSTAAGNSPISSRNSTPRWATAGLAGPQVGRAAADQGRHRRVVVRGPERRPPHQPAGRQATARPPTRCRWPPPRPRGRAAGGAPGRRRASIVLPAPGGPTSSRWWPPAAATSTARRATGWPRTSARSGRCRVGRRSGRRGLVGPRRLAAQHVEQLDERRHRPHHRAAHGRRLGVGLGRHDDDRRPPAGRPAPRPSAPGPACERTAPSSPSSPTNARPSTASGRPRRRRRRRRRRWRGRARCRACGSRAGPG